MDYYSGKMRSHDIFGVIFFYFLSKPYIGLAEKADQPVYLTNYQLNRLKTDHL